MPSFKKRGRFRGLFGFTASEQGKYVRRFACANYHKFSSTSGEQIRAEEHASGLRNVEGENLISGATGFFCWGGEGGFIMRDSGKGLSFTFT